MINGLNKLAFYPPGIVHPVGFRQPKVFNASSVEVSGDSDGDGDEVKVQKTEQDKVNIENKE